MEAVAEVAEQREQRRDRLVLVREAPWIDLEKECRPEASQRRLRAAQHVRLPAVGVALHEVEAVDGMFVEVLVEPAQHDRVLHEGPVADEGIGVRHHHLVVMRLVIGEPRPLRTDLRHVVQREVGAQAVVGPRRRLERHHAARRADAVGHVKRHEPDVGADVDGRAAGRQQPPDRRDRRRLPRAHRVDRGVDELAEVEAHPERAEVVDERRPGHEPVAQSQRAFDHPAEVGVERGSAVNGVGGSNEAAHAGSASFLARLIQGTGAVHRKIVSDVGGKVWTKLPPPVHGDVTSETRSGLCASFLAS